MDIQFKAAIAAWQMAETEAHDAYAVLRIAFLKHTEGICGPPSDALLEKSMAARLRSLAHMQAVIHLLDATPQAVRASAG